MTILPLQLSVDSLTWDTFPPHYLTLNWFISWQHVQSTVADSVFGRLADHLHQVNTVRCVFPPLYICCFFCFSLTLSFPIFCFYYLYCYMIHFYVKFRQYYLESIFIKGGLIIRCTLIHHNQQQTNISKMIREKSLFNKWYCSTWLSACRRMQIHATLHKTQVRVNKRPQHKPR